MDVEQVLMLRQTAGVCVGHEAPDVGEAKASLGLALQDTKVAPLCGIVTLLHTSFGTAQESRRLPSPQHPLAWRRNPQWRPGPSLYSPSSRAWGWTQDSASVASS